MRVHVAWILVGAWLALMCGTSNTPALAEPAKSEPKVVRFGVRFNDSHKQLQEVVTNSETSVPPYIECNLFGPKLKVRTTAKVASAQTRVNGCFLVQTNTKPRLVLTKIHVKACINVFDVGFEGEQAAFEPECKRRTIKVGPAGQKQQITSTPRLVCRDKDEDYLYRPLSLVAQSTISFTIHVAAPTTPSDVVIYFVPDKSIVATQLPHEYLQC